MSPILRQFTIGFVGFLIGFFGMGKGIVARKKGISLKNTLQRYFPRGVYLFGGLVIGSLILYWIKGSLPIKEFCFGFGLYVLYFLAVLIGWVSTKREKDNKKGE
ncbi:hypothetical protein AYK26_00610 [Euryarchaeota archaeon SM23-78]|nr:MAG: hypothetical protein AYK26_00610 [Euryarchaeota archaeon SM23-78]